MQALAGALETAGPCPRDCSLPAPCGLPACLVAMAAGRCAARPFSPPCCWAAPADAGAGGQAPQLLPDTPAARLHHPIPTGCVPAAAQPRLPAARHRRAWTPVTAAASGQQQQPAQAVERRALLLGAAAAAAAAVLQPAGQAAAGEFDCEPQGAAGKLQWCDIATGFGDSPVAGEAAGLGCRRAPCACRPRAACRLLGPALLASPAATTRLAGGVWLRPAAPCSSVQHSAPWAAEAYLMQNCIAPPAGDRIRAHYQGSLPSGEVFDSSYDKGPVTFNVREAGVLAISGLVCSCRKLGAEIQQWLDSRGFAGCALPRRAHHRLSCRPAPAGRHGSSAQGAGRCRPAGRRLGPLRCRALQHGAPPRSLPRRLPACMTPACCRKPSPPPSAGLGRGDPRWRGPAADEGRRPAAAGRAALLRVRVPPGGRLQVGQAGPWVPGAQAASAACPHEHASSTTLTA